jgi:pimeloyl-ACP methyl ester carboxylesterase
MPSVRLTHAEVAYEDTGGEGLPLVLGHGFLMDRTMFQPQVEAFSPRHRVITWDQRGHGDTTTDTAAWSFWDLAEDLAELLDHLQVERAVVGGMSQGGFLALRFALRHPERVTGLVQIDSQAGLEDPGLVSAYDAMNEEWVANGPSDVLAEMVAATILGRPDLYQPWIGKWQARPHDSGTVEPPYRCLMDRDDISARLGEIAAPALVLHGTSDAAIPLARAEALVAGLPRARLVAVPEGTHSSNLSHPEPVNAAIARFLAEVAVPA